MIATSFLIGSSSNLQLTGTDIKSWTLDFSTVWLDSYPPLSAHILQKCCVDDSNFILMGKLCLHASTFIFDRIIIKVADNQDRHKSSCKFDFGPLVSMAQLTLLRCLRRHLFPIYKGHLKKLQTKNVFVLTMYALDEIYGKNL